ncbi:FtsQ-type POTRA domain-containing protein [Kocuria sediminis]|uniref:FtsQ-type POTRA domain-containing protein n=1 Tax=Kocuria sediminis TaxID=1038857 RepID=A0A6N8GLZ9_9MICC|nr:cell division protein FtsQ/DivIB [Kocuria sediminis]MUN64121.1 FtsQ-type POTRA domain-containing protein [Kocuria sediminis]
MSRHGRPHQPRFGEDPRDAGTGAPAPEPAAPETATPESAAPETPAEGTSTSGPLDPGASAGGGRDGGPGDTTGDTAAGPWSAVPAEGAGRSGRVRVNDGTKVSPVSDEDELVEVPAAGGRFSAWRRHRQERAPSRTLTASRVPAEPAHHGSTAVGSPAAGSPETRSPAAGSTAVGSGVVGSSAGGATVVAFPASAGARRRRRRLGAALGALVALAVLAGVLFLSPALAVRDISVRGAQLTDPASVEETLEGYRGIPLTRISKQEVRARVGAVPQVRSIEVVLEPPHHLIVELHERVPVAAVQDGDEFAVVDSEGVRLTTAATAEEAAVPVVTGGPDVLEGERFDAIADVLAALPESVLAQLRTASAESLSSVELTFSDGRTVVWGTAEDSELKAQVLRELVEARGAGSGVETYDVSSPTRPVVR